MTHREKKEKETRINYPTHLRTLPTTATVSCCTAFSLHTSIHGLLLLLVGQICHQNSKLRYGIVSCYAFKFDSCCYEIDFLLDFPCSCCTKSSNVCSLCLSRQPSLEPKIGSVSSFSWYCVVAA